MCISEEPMRLQSPNARLIVLAGLCLLIFAILSIFDFSLSNALSSLGSLLRGDLYYQFRIWGSLWPWLLFSIALALSGKEFGQPNRAKKSGFLLLSPALSGIWAELLKLTLRRERPSQLEAYVFRSFADRPWSSSGLGLPSSHAAVAFGGSMALMILFPRLRWPALVMAIGCALSRVASGAHYVTDVFLGALIGSVCSLVLANWFRIPILRFRQTQPSSYQP